MLKSIIRIRNKNVQDCYQKKFDITQNGAEKQHSDKAKLEWQLYRRFPIIVKIKKKKNQHPNECDVAGNVKMNLNNNYEVSTSGEAADVINVNKTENPLFTSGISVQESVNSITCAEIDQNSECAITSNDDTSKLDNSESFNSLLNKKMVSSHSSSEKDNLQPKDLDFRTRKVLNNANSDTFGYSTECSVNDYDVTCTSDYFKRFTVLDGSPKNNDKDEVNESISIDETKTGFIVDIEKYYEENAGANRIINFSSITDNSENDTTNVNDTKRSFDFENRDPHMFSCELINLTEPEMNIRPARQKDCPSGSCIIGGNGLNDVTKLNPSVSSFDQCEVEERATSFSTNDLHNNSEFQGMYDLSFANSSQFSVECELPSLCPCESRNFPAEKGKKQLKKIIDKNISSADEITNLKNVKLTHSNHYNSTNDDLRINGNGKKVSIKNDCEKVSNRKAHCFHSLPTRNGRKQNPDASNMCFDHKVYCVNERDLKISDHDLTARSANACGLCKDKKRYRAKCKKMNVKFLNFENYLDPHVEYLQIKTGHQVPFDIMSGYQKCNKLDIYSDINAYKRWIELHYGESVASKHHNIVMRHSVNDVCRYDTKVDKSKQSINIISSNKNKSAPLDREEVYINQDYEMKHNPLFKNLVYAYNEMSKNRSTAPFEVTFPFREMQRKLNIERDDAKKKLFAERNLERKKKEGKQKQLIKPTHIASSAINRMKEMERIEKENKRIQQRIRAVKPTKSLRRSELLKAYYQS